MTAQPLPSADVLRFVRLRSAQHPRCVVCSAANPRGLGLQFELQPDGSVLAGFAGSESFAGYPGRLHGGVIAALLDGAMTNCLFAHGHAAFTAELTVRYHRSVGAQEALTLRAWRVDSRTRLHRVRAELRGGNELKASASAKFLESAAEVLPEESTPAFQAPQTAFAGRDNHRMMPP